MFLTRPRGSFCSSLQIQTTSTSSDSKWRQQHQVSSTSYSASAAVAATEATAASWGGVSSKNTVGNLVKQWDVSYHDFHWGVLPPWTHSGNPSNFLLLFPAIIGENHYQLIGRRRGVERFTNTVTRNLVVCDDSNAVAAFNASVFNFTHFGKVKVKL